LWEEEIKNGNSLSCPEETSGVFTKKERGRSLREGGFGKKAFRPDQTTRANKRKGDSIGKLGEGTRVGAA